jgi:hypothetical protein
MGVRAIPASIKIAGHSLPALWARPFLAIRNGRRGRTPQQRHGLLITAIVCDAQNWIENGRLNQSQRSSTQGCRGSLVPNETIDTCLVQDGLVKTNHSGITMNRNLFHILVYTA